MPGAFILALDSGVLEAVELLYSSDKTVVEEQDPEGWSCLHLVVEQGNLDLVRWLVEHGADYNVTN